MINPFIKLKVSNDVNKTIDIYMKKEDILIVYKSEDKKNTFILLRNNNIYEVFEPSFKQIKATLGIED